MLCELERERKGKGRKKRGRKRKGGEKGKKEDKIRETDVCRISQT